VVTDASERRPYLTQPGQPTGCPGFFVGSGLAAAGCGARSHGSRARKCYKKRMPVRLTAAAVCVCLALVATGLDAHARRYASPPGVARPTQSVPPLPSLDIERYPAAAREQISPAYRAALAAPDDGDAVGRLAMVLHAWEELEAAAQTYARAQTVAPANVDWWYCGALLATRRGLHEEAARQFRTALARRPADPLIALRLADAALEAGRVDEAATLYEPLSTRPETAPAAFYGLGRVKQQAGDTTAARKAYEQAIALYADFGAAHYALAQIQRRDGDTTAARASLQRQQQCLACWPVPPDPWRTRLDGLRDDAPALLQRGVATASQGSATAAAEAIRLHEAAIARTPTLGQAHVNLIDLYARTGNLPRAEQQYQTARALPGFTADAHRVWGWVLLQQRRPAEALVALEAATALTPDHAQAQSGRGLALEMLGRPAEAVVAYRAAVTAAPTDRDVRFNLARTLMTVNRPDEAIPHLEQVQQPVDAATPRYRFALSVAHVRRGDVAAGLRIGEEALALARQFNQTDLAQSIERDLAALARQARP
jgi:tetratricopeptide (TPR) repeat protein